MGRYNKNLAGKKFDSLHVVSSAEIKKNGYHVWNCVCECGNKSEVRSKDLIRGSTKSCGNCKRPSKYKNLTGMKFKRLKVIQEVKTNSRGSIVWECLCECGRTCQKTTDKLKRDISCGECSRDWGDHTIITRIYNRTKNNAKTRNIEFKIDRKLVDTLVRKPCYYCGNMDGKEHGITGTVYKLNGIDRMDNTKGYEKQNCVPCCSKCNVAKNNHTKTEFLDWVHSVYNHSLVGGQL